MPRDPRDLLRAMFDAAVGAALPGRVVPAHLPPPPSGRTVVVGAGKASAAMARAVEDAWPGPLEGLVVTRYGHAVPCRRIEIVEAAHPVPDKAGRQAAQRSLSLVEGLGQDDLVIALISGGGSALLSLPAPGLTLEDKQAVNRALLRSGAHIGEMNCVRKHLSAVKGGRLAMPHPEVFEALSPGVELLLDDGKLRLRVETCGPGRAETRVVTGGVLSDRKGVSVVGAVLPVSALTEKDRGDLRYALDLGVDWIALSFVQRPEDLDELRGLGCALRAGARGGRCRRDGRIRLRDGAAGRLRRCWRHRRHRGRHAVRRRRHHQPAEDHGCVTAAAARPCRDDMPA